MEELSVRKTAELFGLSGTISLAHHIFALGNANSTSLRDQLNAMTDLHGQLQDGAKEKCSNWTKSFTDWDCTKKAAQRVVEMLVEDLPRTAERASVDLYVDAATAGERAEQTARKLGRQFDERTRQSLADFEEELRERGSTLDEYLREKANTLAEYLQEKGQTLDEYIRERAAMLDQYVRERAATLEKSIRTELGNAVAFVKDTWWYQLLQGGLLDLFMEEPSFIKVGMQHPGTPVYYVNGMLTSRDSAQKGAEELAHHLRRPVFLIHNPTAYFPPFDTGTPEVEDFGECIYDRIWPFQVMSAFASLTKSALLDRRPRLQENSTTRQVTHLLYHADEPISIVSHSQGCMIIRNACFALFLLGKESWVQQKLAWIAAGTPLNGNEVWPCPKKYERLIDDNDFVAQVIGLSGLPRDNLLDTLADHNFIESYVPRVNAENLW
jgi:hypothetical protein